MLRIINSQGKLKIPVKAYRSHGSEFIIYETSFGQEKWEDIFSSRLCILSAAPSSKLKERIRELLAENNYLNHILVSVIL